MVNIQTTCRAWLCISFVANVRSVAMPYTSVQYGWPPNNNKLTLYYVCLGLNVQMEGRCLVNQHIYTDTICH